MNDVALLSGDFMQVNRYLVEELEALGQWTESMRNRLELSEGSVQRFDELPKAAARDLSHVRGNLGAPRQHPARSS